MTTFVPRDRGNGDLLHAQRRGRGGARSWRSPWRNRCSTPRTRPPRCRRPARCSSRPPRCARARRRWERRVARLRASSSCCSEGPLRASVIRQEKGGVSRSVVLGAGQEAASASTPSLLRAELGAVQVGVDPAACEQLACVPVSTMRPPRPRRCGRRRRSSRAGARSRSRCGRAGPRRTRAGSPPPIRSRGATSPRRGSRSRGFFSSRRAIASRCFSPPDMR